MFWLRNKKNNFYCKIVMLDHLLYSLGRLLMVDLGEDEEKFEQFMMPLAGIIQKSKNKQKYKYFLIHWI